MSLAGGSAARHAADTTSKDHGGPPNGGGGGHGNSRVFRDGSASPVPAARCWTSPTGQAAAGVDVAAGLYLDEEIFLAQLALRARLLNAEFQVESWLTPASRLIGTDLHPTSTWFWCTRGCGCT